MPYAHGGLFPIPTEAESTSSFRERLYINLIFCPAGYSLLKPLPGSALALLLVFTLTEVAIALFLQHPALFAAHKLGVQLFFRQFFIFYIFK
ncbi:hypothetical protein Osc7112_0303 [Oscillatoria nigro-viridis PCC 7112]|uniref:Uncharacterized protein n=1 Tax=Phormidium nigroviride PCC 7112 TaxID=179408 RepID=K9VB53_9CYAN|nr:hypothetical protein Osc7112_0303 [Oscillatoria nigro-viridis PCC 7112]